MYMFIICTMAVRRRKRRRLKRQVVYFLIFSGILLVSVVLLTTKARRTIPYEPAELVEKTRDLHAYDWANLETDGNFASYNDDRYTSLQGIDVSEHQAEIDWEKVKAAGIDFAFIRTGYRGTESGRCTEDRWFRTNMEGASQAGIDIGVYFFSQAITEEEAVEEADYVARQIKGYDVTYPVVFDMEHPETGTDRIRDLSREEKTRIAAAFMSRVQWAGYTPMLYNSTGLLDVFFDMDLLTDYPVWAAEYGSLPRYPYVFEIWQYTNTGRVDGIRGNVDMDIRFTEK